jgi:hypothetical protein
VRLAGCESGRQTLVHCLGQKADGLPTHQDRDERPAGGVLDDTEGGHDRLDRGVAEELR